MVKSILVCANFVENQTFKETRFITPPNCTYAIYLDSYERRGADKKNFWKEHDCTIELYSYQKDPEAEERIEKAFDSFGIEYEKEERYWIEEEQLYQVVYRFKYTEKWR